jgi:BirA family biotin operon repressor/biotin-[acetyl-CoA-carboxylase] ligase
MADSLAADHVEALLAGSFGHPYLYRDVCDSTQRLLDPLLPEGAVAVCDSQAAGRGRLGRSWEAPPGTSVLCSILLNPPAGRRMAELSLVGGLAAVETVEHVTGLSAQIKWPNDVMLNRRKVAGVLAEVAGEAVVLGIGLNVNQRREQLPREAKVSPASLYTTDATRRDRAPILAELIGRLEQAYALWRSGGLDALYDGLGARDFLRGRAVFVNGEPGIAVAIDRRGRLEIEIAGRRRLIESGEVDYEQ